MVSARIPGPLGRDSIGYSDSDTHDGTLPGAAAPLPGPIGHGFAESDEERLAMETASLCARYGDIICGRYHRMTDGETSIVSMDIEGYEFLFDLAHERVVGVLGYTFVSEQTRDTKYMAGFLGRAQSKKQLEQLSESQKAESKKSFQRRFEDKYGAKYDRGHFISLRQGGVYDINLFPQRTDINRGYVDQWRDFERECVNNPGSFCFVRPIYDDETWVPFEIEYGIVRDGITRTRKFPNRR